MHCFQVKNNRMYIGHHGIIKITEHTFFGLWQYYLFWMSMSSSCNRHAHFSINFHFCYFAAPFLWPSLTKLFLQCWIISWRWVLKFELSHDPSQVFQAQAKISVTVCLPALNSPSSLSLSLSIYISLFPFLSVRKSYLSFCLCNFCLIYQSPVPSLFIIASGLVYF